MIVGPDENHLDYHALTDSDGRIGYDDKRNRIYVCPRFEHRDKRLTQPTCDRCGAEGINHMVTTRETLYGVIPQLRENLSSLPGRIHRKLCRHKDISWKLFDERWGMPHPNPFMWGWCQKCGKNFNEQLEWIVEVEDEIARRD